MISPKSFPSTLINVPHITTVQVPLGKRTYPIYIGSGLLKNAGAYFKKHEISKTVIIISDKSVAALYLRTVEKSLKKSGFKVRSIVIPAGESQKNLTRAENIYTQLLQWKIERSCTIAALGGGVIGDLAGFIAATYQRGVGFIQIPTTLLAQVDSSVGGKVGINHSLAKNMIGAFYQPKFVLADTSVLKTLPRREIVCGLGEIIKYGIILDKKFFTFSKTNLTKALNADSEVLGAMVKRSCELKAYVVSKDEREQNLRAILNFGHTIGHALERAGKYSYFKHGEAILYGMVAETELAHALSMISTNEKRNIEAVISSVVLPRLSALKLSEQALIDTMLMDKKAKDGNVRMVLPYRIGKVSLPIPVSKKAIRNSINYLKEYASQ